MTSLMQSKTKKRRIIAAIMAIAMLFTVFMTVNMASAAEGTPDVVLGRILKANEIGDNSDWVEIAQYGDYSLIVRRNYISFNPTALTAKGYTYNSPDLNYSPFGATNKYLDSTARKHINDWFNGQGKNENLPSDSRLRDFAMINNATTRLGTTCNNTTSMYDGLSLPTAKYQSGFGSDVAFALSYSESAQYLSLRRFVRGPIANLDSNAFAQLNFRNIIFPEGPSKGMWLRSVGDIANTAGALYNGYGAVVPGRTFQEYVTITAPARMYLYPAMWVGSGIFLPPPPPKFNLTFDPNGGFGKATTIQVDPNATISIPENVRFDRQMYEQIGWNTERTGTGRPYALNGSITVDKDITLYAQWQLLSVTFDPNASKGGNGVSFKVYPNSDGMFELYDNENDANPRFWNDNQDMRIIGWCSTPDLKDGIYFTVGSKFENFNLWFHESTTLYAVWSDAPM